MELWSDGGPAAGFRILATASVLQAAAAARLGLCAARAYSALLLCVDFVA